MRPQPPRRTTHTTASPTSLLIYDRWGSYGRPVLLLHGLLFDRTMWWPAAADLAGPRCTVVAPDLPGHGQSPPRDDCRFEDLARDLAGLIHGLGLHRAPVVVGHAASARLATAFAEAYAVHHVVAVDPPAPHPAEVGDLVTTADPGHLPAMYRPYGRPVTGPGALGAYRSWLNPPPVRRNQPAMAGRYGTDPSAGTTSFRHLSDPAGFADEIRALL